MKSYPFGGDIYLIWEIFNIIKNNNIKIIIETGSYKGETTQLMSAMVEQVISIEINKDYEENLKCFSEYENISLYWGNSPTILTQLFSKNKIKQPILFFLDAHWNSDYWPLLDELKTIAIYKLKPFIIIHDCYNPLRKGYGYDEYKGEILSFDYIEKYLDNIYGEENYKYYYNLEATGYKRGVIFILPKEDK